MNSIKKAAAAVTLIASATVVNAETFWTNTDIQYLAGSDYLNPFTNKETDGSVITFEHAGAYNWGKSYSFIDIFESDDKTVLSNDTYIELGVDVSLTGGKGFKGAVKDIYLVTQLENGTAATKNFSNLLGGVGLRWNVPGFAFFDTNIYYRNNDLSDDNMQLTTAWSLPFSFGPVAFTFDGFFDVTDAIDSDNDFGGQALFHTQPQLKLDLGNFWNQKNQYYVGVEIDYWKNKFGVKDADQTAIQAMVQINF
ncbi:MAG: DUF5020 family protein [Sinobacterium sp.]|nr:DUF5020 family protein [Sinobacterium sp.]